MDKEHQHIHFSSILKRAYIFLKIPILTEICTANSAWMFYLPSILLRSWWEFQACVAIATLNPYFYINIDYEYIVNLGQLITRLI